MRRNISDANELLVLAAVAQLTPPVTFLKLGCVRLNLLMSYRLDPLNPKVDLADIRDSLTTWTIDPGNYSSRWGRAQARWCVYQGNLQFSAAWIGQTYFRSAKIKFVPNSSSDWEVREVPAQGLAQIHRLYQGRCVILTEAGKARLADLASRYQLLIGEHPNNTLYLYVEDRNGAG